jgi:hypothetical protein
MSELTKGEHALLTWLSFDDGQYGECKGATLDSLIAKGFAVVGGEDSGFDNTFIAKGADLDYRAVSITEAGVDALRGAQ